MCLTRAWQEEGRRIAQEKRLQLEAETKRAMAVQELKDDGDALFAQGNYDDAAVKYGQALSIDPADEDIREILIQSKVNAEAKCNCANLKKNGAAMLAVKEFDGAIVAYTAAVEADGDDAEAKAGLAAATRKKQALELKAQAEALSAKGDHAGSTELLLQAMNLDPDNKDISAEEETEARESKILELKALADKQFATGDYNGAAGNYGLAISLATPGESHPASSAAKLKTLTTTIVVAVPEGCAPGEVIEVEYPDGKTEDWTIPAGAKEGEVFTLAQKVEKTVVPGQEEPAAASSEYCTAATLKEMQDGLAKCNMKTEAREIESQVRFTPSQPQLPCLPLPLRACHCHCARAALLLQLRARAWRSA
jgi:tetratricopeptide (TPR) repeat protein